MWRCHTYSTLSRLRTWIQSAKPYRLWVDLVYDRGFHAIDFTRIEPDEVNGEHLAAVLRMTSANRILVKGWKHALCVARKALHRQNANIANVLVGLTD